jgi:hypothetical protein
MRLTFFIVLFCFPFCVFSQSIERKIIIDKGKFYYTTIDEEFQVATLHAGKYTAAMNTARSLAMPAGRNFSDPVVPFSWDVVGNDLYVINFLMHPLNDRNEAIKKLDLSALKEWTPEMKPFDLIMQGVDANMLTAFDPYEYTIRRSSTLSNFFYDGVVDAKGNYVLAISNNDSLMVWTYSGAGWKHGELMPLKLNGYFSLFGNGENVYIVLSDGIVHLLKNNMMEQPSTGTLEGPLSDGVLVINKDEGTVKFMKNNKIDKGTNLNELINKKAVSILSGSK